MQAYCSAYDAENLEIQITGSACVYVCVAADYESKQGFTPSQMDIQTH